ncbi:la-related protein 1C-like isoform X1 [Canna indica]|uniref:La-related protein 1C-like isoform X1 n=1 Tax=Canna indica TaxID=4628 RepID=A0AAQ3JTD8_9LILI|nr:la-related protein 1C-like isoform X1 [Canna indica]
MSRTPDPSSPSAANRASVLRRETDSARPSSSSPPALVAPADPSDRSFQPVETPGAEQRKAEAEKGGNGGNAGGARGRRLAWNVPANGGSEVGTVMGADSWPALRESASRPSARSSSWDSLKVLSDGSSAAAPPGSMIDFSRLKLNTDNTNPSSIPNHVALAPQNPYPNPNSEKRVGCAGSSSSVNRGSGEPQQPSRSLEMSPVRVNNDQESAPEDLANRGNDNSNLRHNNVVLPQLQSGINPRGGGYNGNRRGNGTGVAGGSPHRGRYNNRRGGFGWTGPRGFNGRDLHMPLPLLQHQEHLQPFVQSPPPPSLPTIPPFLTTPHIRPFFSPIGYEYPSFYCLPPPQPPINHHVPHVVPPSMFHPQADNKRIMLAKQIEYYFSPENLCRDGFLKKHMDDQGWVRISVIATFNRVMLLTKDIECPHIPYILDALRGSTVVEIQGEKIRRRGDWIKWILSRSRNENDSASSSQFSQTLDTE